MNRLRSLKLSLAQKLTLAFLLVAVTAALLIAIFIRLANTNQFNQLVTAQQRTDFQATLVSYYTTNGSWDGVLAYVNRTYSNNNDNGQGGGQPNGGGGFGGGYGGYGRGPGPNQRGPMFGLADSQGRVVIPQSPYFQIGSQIPADRLAQGTPIDINGQLVGTILTPPSPPGLTPEESNYLQRTDLALLAATGGALLVALLVGLLLARTLTRPLQALTTATHRMAGGELGQEVMVRSGDEIGELATAFNQMSRELARAVQARRQMTADIAHELRTPLTVIAGYIESMADGVLAPTPERLAVIYSEIEHLQRLVGDLRTLTQADAGELKLQKQPMTAQELMQRAQAAFEHRAQQKGIALEVQPDGETPPLAVDEIRMAQVLGNLLSNALRYTPAGGRIVLGATRSGAGVDLSVRDTGQGIALEIQPDGDTPPLAVDEIRMAQVLGNLLSNALRYTPAGGRIVLGATRSGSGVDLSVRDTGQGIAPADLPLIFNRFYRADSSRSEEGESGLGLAIVKALVEAHGGTIEAQSQPGQGTTMRIHLPTAGAA